MNNKFLQSIKVIALAMILILGATHVSAFTEPGGAPTAGNVPAPVNTGPFTQEKGGNFGAKVLYAGAEFGLDALLDSIFNTSGVTNISDTLANVIDGYMIAQKVTLSPVGFFGRMAAGNVASNVKPYEGSVVIGAGGLDVNQESKTGAGLVVDVRNGQSGLTRDVFKLFARDIGENRIASVLNKPFFQLWDTLNNKEGIFKGRSIQITEGGPARGKILVSGDNDGTAVWANPGAFIPDIKIVEMKKGLNADASSATAYCPENYAAISVTCDSNHDAGYDTCKLIPDLDINGNTAGYPDGTAVRDFKEYAEYGFYKGGTMSSNANNGSSNLMWLTCLRYQADEIPNAPQFDANGKEIIAAIPENDVCSNIDGIQTTIPDGYVAGGGASGGTVGECYLASTPTGPSTWSYVPDYYATTMQYCTGYAGVSAPEQVGYVQGTTRVPWRGTINDTIQYASEQWNAPDTVSESSVFIGACPAGTIPSTGQFLFLASGVTKNSWRERFFVDPDNGDCMGGVCNVTVFSIYKKN